MLHVSYGQPVLLVMLYTIKKNSNSLKQNGGNSLILALIFSSRCFIRMRSGFRCKCLMFGNHSMIILLVLPGRSGDESEFTIARGVNTPLAIVNTDSSPDHSG